MSKAPSLTPGPWWGGVLWRVAWLQVGHLKGVGSPFLGPLGVGPVCQTQQPRLFFSVCVCVVCDVCVCVYSMWRGMCVCVHEHAGI